jgi:hypothetical protein
MANKRELIAAEDLGWNQFMALMESLSDEQMEVPGYIVEGWSAKDLLAHVGAWQAETVQVLEQIRFGTHTPSKVDVDVLNETFYQANKDLPLPVVRAESWSARTRMLEEWNELPDVTPTAEEWFVESGPAHYAEHLDRLREWVGELSSR